MVSAVVGCDHARERTVCGGGYCLSVRGGLGERYSVARDRNPKQKKSKKKKKKEGGIGSKKGGIHGAL